MCKAACKNKCQPGEKCGKAYGQAHDHTKDAVERTAQHAPAVKIPVGLHAAHEASRRQNAMTEACAIASALASSAKDDDERQAVSALISHASTQEHATLQLLKLVGRIGLRQWFDGDFVVLSKEEARKVADQIDSRGIGSACIAMMNHKIEQAGK